MSFDNSARVNVYGFIGTAILVYLFSGTANPEQKQPIQTLHLSNHKCEIRGPNGEVIEPVSSGKAFLIPKGSTITGGCLGY